ncbi:MAG: hypothetical protein LM523_13700 [Candidatus Contendobacter sp.]|nr:hypothetical protein [Candidatus Contendobacter sp.]
MKRTSEAVFEAAIEAVLLANGYSTVDGKRVVGLRKEHRAALITVAVTGQIPLEEMRA